MTEDLFSRQARLEMEEYERKPEPHDAIWEDYLAWKETCGANHVLRDLYAHAARCYRDYQRFSLRCSMKYLWEVERRHIGRVRNRLKAQGGDLQKWKGYLLNNNFTACIVRDMVAHHPAWVDMFEMRERKAA